MSWDNLKPLIVDEDGLEESLPSLTAPACPVCHNLRYLAALEAGDPAIVKKQMKQHQLTESYPMDIADFASNYRWAEGNKPQYPSIPDYIKSARGGCRCCAFVHILYSAALRLIAGTGYATVNGWGIGATDADIHALVFRLRGSVRLRLTNVKWPSRFGRDRDWDVYSLPNVPNPIPFIREADIMAPMTLQAADTVRKWLRDCVENHPNCRLRKPDFFPKRLIQITAKDISAIPCNPLVTMPFTELPELRIVELDHPVKYAALSYCWGTHKDLWVTSTRNTIHQHGQSINVLAIPRTMQEAIQFSRLLGIEYIWIDALCIIQDDPEDWMVEAAKMGDVYSAAHLVLSANVTKDCTRITAGFQNFGLAYQLCFDLGSAFSTLAPGVQWKEDLGDPRFPMPDKFTPQDVLSLRMAHLHPLVAANGYRPLDNRGWACQESLLGRRMLSLTSFECYWSCDQSAACECGFNQIAVENRMPAPNKGYISETLPENRVIQRIRRAYVEGRLTEDLPSIEVIFVAWHRLVGDYSRREITVEGDKVVAISGLARIFGRVLAMLAGEKVDGTSPPRYLAGIWTSNIHSDLLWMTQRFPETLAAPIQLTRASGTSQNSTFPSNSQQEIANEPYEAAAARLKYFQTIPVRPSAYRAPTWSWASSNLCILWLIDQKKWNIECRGSPGSDYTVSTTLHMSVLETQTEAEPDEYGAVLTGFITVEGPLVEVRRRCVPPSADSLAKLAAVNLHPSPLLESESPGWQSALGQLSSETAAASKYAFVRTENGQIYEYFPDDEFEPRPLLKQSEYDCLFNPSGSVCISGSCGCKIGWSEEPFWCLRVSRTTIAEESGPTWLLDGWLVLRRSEDCDAFERVGVGYFGKVAAEAGGLRLFEDAVKTTITII